MEEVWKDVEGYEGLYQVSNLGRIKSLPRFRVRGMIRKPVKDVYGYFVIMLHKNGIKKTKSIHRLVAETFLEKSDGLLEVNHKNEIKTDNRVENLEWCTRRYNVNYGTANQKRSRSSKNCKSTSKPVFQISTDGIILKKYPSLCEAHRQNGYSMSSLSLCCNSKKNTAYGYIWRYAS